VSFTVTLARYARSPETVKISVSTDQRK
jgi:hypothetical protein